MGLKQLLTPEGWEVVEAAKAMALAEEVQEIGLGHLLQAVAFKQPSLMKGGLTEAGLSGEAAQRCIEAVLPTPSSAELAEAPPMRLSTALEALVLQAQKLADEHPADPSRLVTPLHLWASLCGEGSALTAAFGACQLSPAQVERLQAAALEQLPPKQQPVGQQFMPTERRVLDQFCRRNLTELAREQRLTPAFGMDTPRDQIVRSLLKKNRRSVVLTGPAGVGKTKLMEDLALSISEGKIPELAGCQVYELDLAQFTRGTHLAGSRSERWAQLTGVLRAHAQNVILFIDELHTIVGLPLEGQAMDLANALKPLMVDDSVRIVGATTVDEYRRYIEGDPALARRFTEVKVPEPDRQSMLNILSTLSQSYEQFHGVRYSVEAFDAIYELAHLYFPNLAFPAKGVDLLDEVGVYVRMKHQAARSQPAADPPTVGPEDVRETLKRVWGIEPSTVTVDVAALLKQKVVGQDHAAQSLADAVITAGMGYGRDRGGKPRAIMLFLGPPGVGKSYMAEVLSEILFPGRRSLLALDMTEFGGAHGGEHARFRLVGPPPPYVGWESGGLLTSHVLRHPVSVVLVDEFDKAGPEAQNILLRVFNDGWVEDGRGRIVSFRGIYFILTANAGGELWDRDSRRSIGFIPQEQGPGAGAESTEQDIREALLKDGFAPELLSRLTHVVVFNELSPADLEQIARIRLAELSKNALIEDQVLLDYDHDALPAWVVAHISGPGDTRRLQGAFERHIETPVATWRWQRNARSEPVLLRLEPGEDRVMLAAEGGQQATRELYKRMAAMYEEHAKRARQIQMASAMLGAPEKG